MGEVFQVFLIGLAGAEYTIDVATSEREFLKTTTEKLKALVANKLKITIGKSLGNEEIGLVYSEKQLEGTATLDQYGIKPKSTIFLVILLPGGAK